MWRAILAGAIEGVRPFPVLGYGIWGTKIILIDSDVDPLFAVAAISLSVYGLWLLVRNATDYVIVRLSPNGGHPAA